MKFESEAKPAGRRNERCCHLQTGSRHWCSGQPKPAIVQRRRMAAADLHTIHGVRHGELIVMHVVLGKRRILVADIGLVPNVIAADVDIACLADGQIKFKASYSKIQSIFGQLNQPANVTEFQVAISQATGSVVTGNAESSSTQKAMSLPKLPAVKRLNSPVLKSSWERMAPPCPGAPTNQSCRDCPCLLEKSIHPRQIGNSGNASRPDRVWKSSFWAAAPRSVFGIFNRPASSVGNLKPASLNAFPKSFNLGKSEWQVVHDVPYWRAKAGMALTRRKKRRMATHKDHIALCSLCACSFHQVLLA